MITHLKKPDDLKPNRWNPGVYGSEELGDGYIASIEKNGIREAIVIKPDNTIMSGHRRWHAAKMLNMALVPVCVEEYESEVQEREAFIDYNRYRDKTFKQKMNEAEFIEITEKMKAKDRQGTRNDLTYGTNVAEVKKPERVNDKVAEQVGFGSGKTYERAKTIWNEAKQGNPEAAGLLDRIDSGTMTIHSAYKKINQKPAEEPPPMPEGQFNVIYADPPWRYEFSQTSMRAIENHYPTMDLEDIKRLEIPVAEKAVLLLWATAPKLEEALEVLNAWGFTYKTCAVWDKEKIGMGYWFRGQHELLLLGVKGNFPAPAEGNRFSSVIRSPRTGHSKKPQDVYTMIEAMFPHGKYLELFSREKRSGWGGWGNESE